MCPSDENHLVVRRREILTAAEKVFEAHGYAAATVDAVAEEAGVAKGSVYNYFENKRDLFTQVFTEVIASEEAATDTVLSEEMTAAEKLERLLDQWFGRLEHYRKIGRLILEFWATAAREQQDGDMGSWFSDMYSRWRATVANIIIEGLESGEFDNTVDPSVAAALIVAVLDGVVVQVILGMGLKLDEELITALKRSIFAALTAEIAGEAPQS